MAVSYVVTSLTPAILPQLISTMYAHSSCKQVPKNTNEIVHMPVPVKGSCSTAAPTGTRTLKGVSDAPNELDRGDKSASRHRSGFLHPFCPRACF